MIIYVFAFNVGPWLYDIFCIRESLYIAVAATLCLG